ncbi:radical SAM protein [Brachyspira hyodysenteriae]|uniref:radical SAM protein n=1 Tax=Brachyspira hyodysenteriae TaxID=159 RepID=UPI000CA17F19|nr:radical SAM protein [Brachyspira hyodysenteriae]AUJ51062.1 Radical SAM domain protein [Brachyspira hyodysenteriae]
MILRSKTKELLQTRTLTEKQINNTKLNKEEMDKKAIILKSYPQRLVLELTNACNLRCIMCGRDEAEFAPTVFKLDYLKKMEKLLDTIEEVTLFGWGEPTMHPNFIEILEYLNNFPVRKYFVTNGMRLDKIKNALFDYQVDIMAISLDGAKAETNDRIRFGGNFNLIVKNIRDIVKERKNRGVNYPYMNFVMALMDSNIEELPQLIELASDIGLEEVKGVYLTVFTNNLLNETLYNKQDKVIKIFNESEELAKKLNIKLKLPYIQGEDIAENKYHKGLFCSLERFFLSL